jgi:hypothetical protein
LAEISLNPKFEGLEAEELKRKSDSVKLRLKKETAKLWQIEHQKDKLVVQFESLTEALPVEKPAWLLHLNWLFTNWRIKKTQEKIEALNQRFRKQTETVIEPLQIELGDLEEEIKHRNAIKPSMPKEVTRN